MKPSRRITCRHTQDLHGLAAETQNSRLFIACCRNSSFSADRFTCRTTLLQVFLFLNQPAQLKVLSALGKMARFTSFYCSVYFPPSSHKWFAACVFIGTPKVITQALFHSSLPLVIHSHLHIGLYVPDQFRVKANI